MVPAVWWRRPAIIISSEVLPQPLGPTITTKRPAPTVMRDIHERRHAAVGPGIDVAEALDLDRGARRPVPRSSVTFAMCCIVPPGSARPR